MAIRTFVLTDQWKTPSTGDAEGAGSILRHGISGDVTLTPVVPPGLRVEDDPRAWAMLSRPLQASYHLGRLIGPDGRDGVRLLGWVDAQPVSWRVQRELRFNGERLPRLPAVTITPAGDVVHLPDAAPVDEADMEAIGQVLVDLGAVRAELAAAVDAATRAEGAAAGIAAAADRAVDAEQEAAEARADAVSARDGAVDARDAAVGAAGGVAADAGRAEVAAGRAEVAAGATLGYAQTVLTAREPMTMVSVDEVAMENTEPQITPTYDDTGQTVHPDVVRIPGGFGPQGFEYWMGMTPYPDGNAATENPSIIASHDGETWVVPDGLTNPIAAPPTGFWPDPDVFFDHAIRRLYLVWLGMRISWSDDGVQWTEPVLLTPSLAGEVSPALVMESPRHYSMWSCQKIDGQINKILRRQATSLEDPNSGWDTPPVECVFTPPPGLEPWHIDVQKVGHGYWALISFCLENTSGAAAELYFATSLDGIRWDIGREPVLSGRRGEWDDTNIYRATLIPSDGRGDVLADVWYSARSATGQWRIARTQLTHRSPALAREVSRLAPLGLPADHLDTVRMSPNAKNLFPGDPTLMTPAGIAPLGWVSNLPGATDHGWDQSREAYRVTGASGALIFQNDPPAIPGQWYTLSAEFASPDAGAARVSLQFFDADGVLISGDSGRVVTGREDFQTMFVSLQAPANASTMRLFISPRHKTPIGTGYYRRVQLEEGISPTAWTSGVASEIRLDGVHDAQQVMVSPTDIRWRIGPDGVPVLPRFSDVDRPSASDSGLGAMIWNSTTGRMEVSAGVDWVPVGETEGSGGSGSNLITFNPSLMIPALDGIRPEGWENNLVDATGHGWDLNRGAYTVRAKGYNIRLLATVPIEGPQWYTMSVEVASPDAGRARLGISWKDSSGATISGTASAYTTAPSEFQRITHTLQAPPHARSAELTIQPGTPDDGLREFFLRNVIFERGTTASKWQSGANIRTPKIITTGRVLEASDNDVMLDINSGTVMLPAPTEEGQVHRLKNVADTPIEVASRSNSVLIDGQPSLTLSPGDAVTVMLHSGQWITMS